jgi:hypothetical protein
MAHPSTVSRTDLGFRDFKDDKAFCSLAVFMLCERSHCNVPSASAVFKELCSRPRSQPAQGCETLESATEVARGIVELQPHPRHRIENENGAERLAERMGIADEWHWS